MSPSRKTSNDDDAFDQNAPSILADGDDAEDPRTFEDDDAEAVRNGDLSAAQLPSGHGNVDPGEPDAQYPPGVIQNTAAKLNPTDSPADFVPERKRAGMSPTPSNIESAGIRTTAATPDYGTNSEE